MRERVPAPEMSTQLQMHLYNPARLLQLAIRPFRKGRTQGAYLGLGCRFAASFLRISTHKLCVTGYRECVLFPKEGPQPLQLSTSPKENLRSGLSLQEPSWRWQGTSWLIRGKADLGKAGLKRPQRVGVRHNNPLGCHVPGLIQAQAAAHLVGGTLRCDLNFRKNSRLKKVLVTEWVMENSWCFPRCIWVGSVVVAFFLGTIPAKHLSMCLIKSCGKFQGLESMQLNPLLGT